MAASLPAWADSARGAPASPGAHIGEAARCRRPLNWPIDLNKLRRVLASRRDARFGFREDWELLEERPQAAIRSVFSDDATRIEALHGATSATPSHRDVERN